MSPTLVFVSALMSYVSSAPLKSSPGAELSTSSLHYVYAFFRHGIRSPLYEPYPTDPNKEEFHKLFKGSLGELTAAGKQEMFDVGQRLLANYGDFVGDFSLEKVYASTTDLSRTIMSAQSLMAGFFPPKKPIIDELEKWQPIPIWHEYKDFDKAYFYNDPNFPKLALKQCPRYGKMIKKGYDIIKKKDQDESRRMIYELLQQETGKPDVNSINKAYAIYDILEMEHLNGLGLPEWATKPQPKLHNKPLYPDLMRPLQVDWFYKCQWLNRDPQMLLFYSGPLFYSINEKFTDKINNKNNKERFRYHNTHDDTILTLRWALGFDVPSFEVEAGDGIAFELHKLEEKYFVQAVYYHSLREPEEFREVLQLPKCPSPCSYEQFSKQYKSLSPKEWNQECRTPSLNVATNKMGWLMNTLLKLKRSS